ncbi:MAG TPA: ATP-grasp domain-containing protein [Methanobacterium sp.]
MKLLVFEFATAMGLDDPTISAEGHAMLYGLLEDLKDLNTYHLVSNDSQSENSESIKVVLNGDIGEWLHKNIKDYDLCFPIAPEESNILHDLTLIIEDEGVEIIGSSSKAVKLTTNKFNTYNVLKDKFPVIKTEKIYFNDSERKSSECKNSYQELFKSSSPKVVKPADGVSCSGVIVVNSYNELMVAQDKIKILTKLPYFILQDYVSGVNVSVSLLSNGDSAVPLSLNFQDVHLNSGEINYSGGKVPIEHDLSEIAMETAKNAVESIDGLKGYIGVDMILNKERDKVHIVEINSRLTTPYVALRSIINFNLGEAVINSVHGELPAEVILDGEVNFYKEDNNLRVSVLK